jgi:ATP-dependent Lon protease
VEAEPIVDDIDLDDSLVEPAREYRAVARTLLERMGGRRFAELLDDVESPGALADTVGWWPDLSLDRRVELLETVDVAERLAKATSWLKEALADVELSEKIRSDVTDGMEKTQRDFLLRQQLAAIKKELGDDVDDDLVGDFRDRLAAADGSPRQSLPTLSISSSRKTGFMVPASVMARTMRPGWAPT